MSTQTTDGGHEFRYHEPKNFDGVQTLVTRVWQSDEIFPKQISSIINAWYRISQEHPEVIVERWEIVQAWMGTALNPLSKYILVVQIMCPESWDTSGIDRIILA